MLKVLLLLTSLVLTAARGSHFYRKDYTFFEEFDAYYKLHWDDDGVSWNSAFMSCDDEGAKLFYPRENEEWTIVKNLTALFSESLNVTDVIIGIHDEFGQGEFVTVDGLATPASIIDELSITEGQDCVIMDLDTGMYKTEPCVTNPPSRRIFGCKKIDEKPCRTIDLEYKYSKETKKCYKVNRRQKTWQEAWHTCFMEGAMLVSPENELEADVIYKFISKNDNYYFSGFRKVFGRNPNFYTVKGQKLEETGFQRWNHNRQESESNCGVVYASGSYLYMGTEDCSKSHSFICEMPARSF